MHVVCCRVGVTSLTIETYLSCLVDGLLVDELELKKRSEAVSCRSPGPAVSCCLGVTRRSSHSPRLTALNQSVNPIEDKISNTSLGLTWAARWCGCGI